jgi:phospholipid/cholesterol/gamma-HCH transport system substrate-binding protein
MRAKEFKIGLIALAAGLTLYFGFSYLKGRDFMNKETSYYVVYDNVDGLTKSNPVIINGLTVGKVRNIQLRQDFNNQVVVELAINSEIILGDSTIAELSNADLLGSKAIVLKIGPIDTPLAAKDTLKAIMDRGLAEYLDNVQPITDNLNVTIRRINEILLGLQGSGEKITSTISELEITLKGINELLSENKEGFALVIHSTNEVLTNVNNKINDLDPIFKKAEDVLDSLNNLDLSGTLVEVQDLMKALKSTVSAINQGQGTMGQLMVNDSLYNNLNQLLFDLDKLTLHFNQYPKDFLKPLGRKSKKMKGLESLNN